MLYCDSKSPTAALLQDASLGTNFLHVVPAVSSLVKATTQLNRIIGTPQRDPPPSQQAGWGRRPGPACRPRRAAARRLPQARRRPCFDLHVRVARSSLHPIEVCAYKKRWWSYLRLILKLQWRHECTQVTRSTL